MKKYLTAPLKFAAANPLITGIVLGTILLFGHGYISSGLNSVSNFFTDVTTNRQTREAGAKVAEASRQMDEANEIKQERAIVDAVREQTIEPRVRAARTQSSETRRRLQSYETTNTNRRPSNLPDRELHRRNCAEFARAFPGYQLDNCQR